MQLQVAPPAGMFPILTIYFESLTTTSSANLSQHYLTSIPNCLIFFLS
uniref:Uncharacterized protein n=1 Tax=Arundo donax TaxID=35708 RepID=A0A0A9CR58_ARUDO